MFITIFALIFIFLGGGFVIRRISKKTCSVVKIANSKSRRLSNTELSRIQAGDDDYDDRNETTSERSTETAGTLNCQYIGTIQESDSDQEQEEEVEDVYVEHVRSQGCLDCVEVLKVRHKSGRHSRDWRDVQVTASILNYSTLSGKKRKLKRKLEILD